MKMLQDMTDAERTEFIHQVEALNTEAYNCDSLALDLERAGNKADNAWAKRILAKLQVSYLLKAKRLHKESADMLLPRLPEPVRNAA